MSGKLADITGVEIVFSLRVTDTIAQVGTFQA